LLSPISVANQASACEGRTKAVWRCIKNSGERGAGHARSRRKLSHGKTGGGLKQNARRLPVSVVFSFFSRIKIFLCAGEFFPIQGLCVTLVSGRA